MYHDHVRRFKDSFRLPDQIEEIMMEAITIAAPTDTIVHERYERFRIGTSMYRLLHPVHSFPEEDSDLRDRMTCKTAYI
jgi:hypothetical protein